MALVDVELMRPKRDLPDINDGNSSPASYFLKEVCLSEVSFCTTAPDASISRIICGQETPEWQGFIPGKTHQQPDFHPIPTASLKYKGRDLRIATAISADKRLTGLAAGTVSADTQIRLLFADRHSRILDEDQLRAGR